MSYNLSLAIIPVFLGYFMLKTRSKRNRIILGIFWLTFLPNTIYMITDINHLLEQWNTVSIVSKAIIFPQYIILMVLAVVTFIAAQYPFEKIISKGKKLDSIKTIATLVAIDLFVAFGVILGGIERVNSWEIITNPLDVIKSIMTLFQSNAQVGLIIGFGGLFSIIYFSFKDSFLQILKRVRKI